MLLRERDSKYFYIFHSLAFSIMLSLTSNYFWRTVEVFSKKNWLYLTWSTCPYLPNRSTWAVPLCLQTTLSHINEAEVAKGRVSIMTGPVCLCPVCLYACTTEVSNKSSTVGCCGSAGPPEESACKPYSTSAFFVLRFMLALLTAFPGICIMPCNKFLSTEWI